MYLFLFRYSPSHGVYCDIASCHLSGIWDSGLKPESAKGKLGGGRGSTRTSEQSHFIFTVVLFFEIHLNIADKNLTSCEYCPKNNPNLPPTMREDRADPTWAGLCLQYVT